MENLSFTREVTVEMGAKVYLVPSYFYDTPAGEAVITFIGSYSQYAKCKEVADLQIEIQEDVVQDSINEGQSEAVIQEAKEYLEKLKTQPWFELTYVNKDLGTVYMGYDILKLIAR